MHPDAEHRKDLLAGWSSGAGMMFMGVPITHENFTFDELLKMLAYSNRKLDKALHQRSLHRDERLSCRQPRRKA